MGLLALLTTVAATTAVLVGFRDAVATRALDAWLDRQGVALVAEPQVEIGPTRASVAGIRTSDGGLAVQRVVADYRLADLLSTGRAERIVVSGLSIRGEVTADGRIRIAPLPARAAPTAADRAAEDRAAEDRAAGRLAPPFDRLTLTDAHLALATPAGDVDVTLAGEARRSRDGLAIVGIAGAVHDAATLSASFDARVSPDGAADIFSRVERGRLRAGDLRLDGLRGWLAGRIEGGALSTTGAELTAARLGAGPVTLAPVSVLAAGDPWPRSLGLRAGGPGASRWQIEAHRAGTAPSAPLSLTADLTVPSLAAALSRLVDLPPGDAAVRLQLDLDLPAVDWRDPPTPLAWQGQGRLRAMVADAHLAGVFRQGAGSVDAGFALAAQRLRLTGLAPWRVTAVPYPSAQPVSLALGDAEATIGWGDAPAAALRSRLALRVGDQRRPLAGPIDVAIHGGETGWRLDRLAADLTGGAFRLGETVVRPATVRVTAAGSVRDFTADVALAAGVDGVLADVIEVVGGRFAVAGLVDRAGDQLTIRPAGCLALSAEAVTIDDVTRLPQGLSLCLQAGDDPAASIVFDRGRPAGWRAAADSADVAVVIDADGELIDLRVPRLRLEAERRDGAAQMRLILRDAGVALPLSDVAADAIDAALTLRTGGGGATAADIVLDDARARLTDAPPRVTSVRVTGRGAIEDWRALTFAANGIGADGALRLSADGVVSLVGGGGRIDIEVAPITFATGILRPTDVFPILIRTPIIAADGILAGDGHYGWGAMRSRQALIRAEDLMLLTENGTASGINAVVAVDEFIPIVVQPGQRVRAQAVDIGLVFEQGEVVFGIPDGRQLDILAADFDWLGGVVSADPFSVALDNPERRVTLRASGVDLGRLLDQVPLNGLSATGTLRGAVPLRLSGDNIWVDDAILEAVAPGIIRYDPQDALPDFGDETGSVDLLLEAARNFHYEDLSLTVAGRTGDQLSARLRLVGGNPDLFDGYPVALTVNLEGALDQILRRGIAVSEVGAFTQEYFERLSEGLVTDDFIEELERLGE